MKCIFSYSEFSAFGNIDDYAGLYQEKILLRKEKGKILIEGMDLSGKTTITKYLSEILNVNKQQTKNC